MNHDLNYERISCDGLDALIRFFNKTISRYGYISVGDIKEFLRPMDQLRYTDYKFGFTETIKSSEFTVHYTQNAFGGSVYFTLNLPDAKEL